MKINWQHCKQQTAVITWHASIQGVEDMISCRFFTKVAKTINQLFTQISKYKIEIKKNLSKTNRWI
jgi:hypothetical protein